MASGVINQTISLMSLSMPRPVGSTIETPWGWHLVLNLYECNPMLIASAQVIEKYVIDLCDLIKMRRFGAPTIVNFGDDPRVSGYSLVQLIETSNICGHFANESAAAYLDIFSCQTFDPQLAAEFSALVFEAKKATGVFISRD
jgi:S-adenosylmethionine/arginine decarboxylase-like enzyme